MRKAFCDSLLRLSSDEDLVFLTGDLGFNALEKLREFLKSRFINAGVAEQNMVSVAAGLSQIGLKPWVYSIAPFLYARAFEQIRNDLCLHKLPVVLVGNGGGYGYGVMGATHHAIEDYGALLLLQNIHVFVPACASDVSAIVEIASKKIDGPTYIRLGKNELPEEFNLPDYKPIRQILTGGRATLVTIGPIIGPIVSKCLQLSPNDRPDCWVIAELPLSFENLPLKFLESISNSNSLLIVEEHVKQGGMGNMLIAVLGMAGKLPKKIKHYSAKGYLTGLYGSQEFHRRESHLDCDSILENL